MEGRETTGDESGIVASEPKGHVAGDVIDTTEELRRETDDLEKATDCLNGDSDSLRGATNDLKETTNGSIEKDDVQNGPNTEEDVT